MESTPSEQAWFESACGEGSGMGCSFAPWKACIRFHRGWVCSGSHRKQAGSPAPHLPQCWSEEAASLAGGHHPSGEHPAVPMGAGTKRPRRLRLAWLWQPCGHRREQQQLPTFSHVVGKHSQLPRSSKACSFKRNVHDPPPPPRRRGGGAAPSHPLRGGGGCGELLPSLTGRRTNPHPRGREGGTSQPRRRPGGEENVPGGGMAEVGFGPPTHGAFRFALAQKGAVRRGRFSAHASTPAHSRSACRPARPPRAAPPRPGALSRLQHRDSCWRRPAIAPVLRPRAAGSAPGRAGRDQDALLPGGPRRQHFPAVPEPGAATALRTSDARGSRPAWRRPPGPDASRGCRSAVLPGPPAGRAAHWQSAPSLSLPHAHSASGARPSGPGAARHQGRAGTAQAAPQSPAGWEGAGGVPGDPSARPREGSKGGGEPHRPRVPRAFAAPRRAFRARPRARPGSPLLRPPRAKRAPHPEPQMAPGAAGRALPDWGAVRSGGLCALGWRRRRGPDPARPAGARSRRR